MEKVYQNIKYTNDKGEDVALRQVKILSIVFFHNAIKIHYEVFMCTINEFVADTLMLPIISGFKLIID